MRQKKIQFWESIVFPYLVISKRVSRKQSTPNFLKNEHFLPPDTHTYVCVSVGKKCLCVPGGTLACFVFLKYPFWDSPFWLITDALWGFITKHNRYYYKVRQSFYCKMQQKFIIKCVWFFIKKWDICYKLCRYKKWRTFQIVLAQFAITQKVHFLNTDIQLQKPKNKKFQKSFPWHSSAK